MQFELRGIKEDKMVITDIRKENGTRTSKAIIKARERSTRREISIGHTVQQDLGQCVIVGYKGPYYNTAIPLMYDRATASLTTHRQNE